MIERFDEYEDQILRMEDIKFKKNQKSLEDLKELFDINREVYANGNKTTSTNDWEKARKVFSPQVRRVDNE